MLVFDRVYLVFAVLIYVTWRLYGEGMHDKLGRSYHPNYGGPNKN